MAILEMKNIRKAFSGEEILKGISLSCKEGEVLSIIGPSGSGKSTLLRIATLLEKAEGGELFYDGKAIFSLTEGQKKQATKEEKEEAKKLFGLVFQNFNLFPHWTVVKNVMDPLIHVQKKTKEEAEEKAKAVLSQMGLLEKNVSWISLFISIAPMLGFMGTVIGMIQAFEKISLAGGLDASLIAGDIQVALLTTVFGLIVAMILQVFYNYIVAKVDSIVNDMEDASISLVDLLVSYRK